ncbi:hypothetical protein ACJX0J_039289, partial [Zea mays]
KCSEVPSFGRVQFVRCVQSNTQTKNMILNVLDSTKVIALFLNLVREIPVKD